MLDEFARRLFDKFAPSKAAISAFLLDKFARRANSLLKLGTLLNSVNAPLAKKLLHTIEKQVTRRDIPGSAVVTRRATVAPMRAEVRTSLVFWQSGEETEWG
jgi:CRP-like cAMP-binding protein